MVHTKQLFRRQPDYTSGNIHQESIEYQNIIIMDIKHFFCLWLFFLSIHISQSNYDQSKNDWDYGNHETKIKRWPEICQSGKKQSPINIDTSKVQEETNVDPFVLSGYKKRIYGEMSVLQNNGHTIKFGFNTKEHTTSLTPSIQGGGMIARKYYFLQAHLHWGATNYQGSEHTINNEHTPLELHMVHWNADLGYSVGYNVEEALATGSYDVLAVLSVQFKIGNKNKNLDSFFRSVDKVTKQGSKGTITNGVKLHDFLPQNKDAFYRYNGSLTTPGCEEIVVWTIFKEQIEISQDQMDVLREVTYKHSHHMDFEADLSNNYRPTQNLNGRTVLDVSKNGYQVKKEPSVAIAGWGSGYQDSSSTADKDIAGTNLLITLETLGILFHFRYNIFT